MSGVWISSTLWRKIINTQIRLWSDPKSMVLWSIFSSIFVGEAFTHSFLWTSDARWMKSPIHLGHMVAGALMGTGHHPTSQMEPHGAAAGSLPEQRCSASWSLNPSAGRPRDIKHLVLSSVSRSENNPSPWFFVNLFSSRRGMWNQNQLRLGHANQQFVFRKPKNYT